MKGNDEKGSPRGENPETLTPTDYNDLREQMSRIEMKLDQLLATMSIPIIEPTKPFTVSSFRQRCNEANTRGLLGDQRRTERELERARLKAENKI